MVHINEKVCIHTPTLCGRQARPSMMRIPVIQTAQGSMVLPCAPSSSSMCCIHAMLNVQDNASADGSLYFLGAAFFAAGFLAGAFFVGVFLAAVFFTAGFFAGVFLAAGFFATVFLTAGFFTTAWHRRDARSNLVSGHLQRKRNIVHCIEYRTDTHLLLHRLLGGLGGVLQCLTQLEACLDLQGVAKHRLELAMSTLASGVDIRWDRSTMRMCFRLHTCPKTRGFLASCPIALAGGTQLHEDHRYRVQSDVLVVVANVCTAFGGGVPTQTAKPNTR